MDNKVNYTLVGVFVIALFSALIVIILWLSGSRHDKVYNAYLTYINEDVTGLSLQSPVRFNGVQVGYVSQIILDPRNPQLVKITLKIEQGTPVTTSTVVTLLPMGITGIVYAGLNAQTPNAPLLGVKPGFKYPVIPSKPSFLMQLGNVLPELATNLKVIGRDFSKLLDEKNRRAISASLQHISVITDNLAGSSGRLNAITANLDETLRHTSMASKQFPAVMAEFRKTMKSIRQTSLQVNSLSGNVRQMVHTGTVMFDNLNDQLLPASQQMLARMQGVMSNLDTLSAEAANNPSVLIRGKEPALPGPGETK
jgi:phospholipid/cholesterol/gamma-HCH transport system substrate-binding protein